MIYNETFIGVAPTVSSLLYTLSTYVPKDATIEMGGGDRQCNVEVWYDKGTNTVILK